MLSNVSSGAIFFAAAFWGITLAYTICQIYKLSQQKKRYDHTGMKYVYLPEPTIAPDSVSVYKEKKAESKIETQAPIFNEEKCMAGSEKLEKSGETTQSMETPENYKQYFIQIEFVRIAGEPSDRKELFNKQIISIGRSENCDVVVNDINVSRFHADIIYGNKKIYIKDRESTNKTYINGRPLFQGKTEELPENALVSMGNSSFRVKNPDAHE